MGIQFTSVAQNTSCQRERQNKTRELWRGETSHKNHCFFCCSSAPQWPNNPFWWTPAALIVFSTGKENLTCIQEMHACKHVFCWNHVLGWFQQCLVMFECSVWNQIVLHNLWKKYNTGTWGGYQCSRCVTLCWSKGWLSKKPKGMSLTQEESRRDGRAEETLTLSLFPVREKYWH